MIEFLFVASGAVVIGHLFFLWCACRISGCVSRKEEEKELEEKRHEVL